MAIVKAVLHCYNVHVVVSLLIGIFCVHLVHMHACMDVSVIVFRVVISIDVLVVVIALGLALVSCTIVASLPVLLALLLASPCPLVFVNFGYKGTVLCCCSFCLRLYLTVWLILMMCVIVILIAICMLIVFMLLLFL